MFLRAEKLFSKNAKFNDGKREVFMGEWGLLFNNFTVILSKPTGEPG